MHKPKPITMTSALEVRGRARLMLRMPHHRLAFAAASSDRFLDICEAYELTWNALGYWSKSPTAEQADRMQEYFEIVADLEREAAQRAAAENKKRQGPA